MCMNSFLGFGSQYVDRYHARTGQRAYFHITRTRKAKVDTLFLLYDLLLLVPHGHISKLCATLSVPSLFMPDD